MVDLSSISMKFFFGTDKRCGKCDVIKTVLSIIFTAAMTLTIVGAYESHIGIGGFTFGSSEASLSILALVITLMLWTTNLDCSNCPDPKIQKVIVFVFLILATITSMIGIVYAHFHNGVFLAGTVDGSLSILSFAITSTYWAKHVQVVCSVCHLK